MITNLPLLFAGGNPAALCSMKMHELERFITFMVHCSWGHDTVKYRAEIRKPPWWPQDVNFAEPFHQPEKKPKDWSSRLMRLVRCCYDYHKSGFLLAFSAQLASYPQHQLRYVDNRDRTTSLYYRPTGRLLVTFRNENLEYDLPEESLKKNLLLAPIPKAGPLRAPVVKPGDVYLCDTCDLHFDDVVDLQNHERECSGETDLLDEPGEDEENCKGEFEQFLSSLRLCPVGDVVSKKQEKDRTIVVNSRKMRSRVSLDLCHLLPFSSKAALRRVRGNREVNTTTGRERLERYCATTTNNTERARFGMRATSVFSNRYRRTPDHWDREYKYPKQGNKYVLDLPSQLRLLKCKSVKVVVERMSKQSMDDYLTNLANAAKQREKTKMDLSRTNNNCTRRDITSVMVTDECQVIDLCSDEESEEDTGASAGEGSGAEGNENCDPCVGEVGGVGDVGPADAVMCWVTGAVPHALPAEPCGAARRRDTPDSLAKITPLQPQPLILYTHSLNNAHIIPLD